MVCSNAMNIQDDVNQVVIHELIHAYDECRAANLDWTNCAQHACSEMHGCASRTESFSLIKSDGFFSMFIFEKTNFLFHFPFFILQIRAGHLSGDCHFKRELLRGYMKIRGHEQECVRRRVMKSMSGNPHCSEAAAKDAMEAVWDLCYGDTQPFDRAP